MRISDETLLERWARYRDAEAFTQLTRRHASMVYGTCLRILGNAADAEDVSQECFARLVRTVPHGKVRSLGGWLHTVAANLSVDRLRAEKRRERYARAAGPMVTPRGTASELDDVHAYVDEAIAGLPEELRSVVVAHFLGGQTHREIAEALNLPRTTVTSRVARGIDRIRETLRKNGVAVSVSAVASLLTAEGSQSAPASLVATLGKLSLHGVPSGPGVATAGLSAPAATVSGKLLSVGIACAVIAVAAIVGTQYAPADGGPAAPVVQPSMPPMPELQRDSLEPGQTSGDAIAGLHVAGHVVDSRGGPLADARIVLKVAGSREPTYETTSASDGHFVFHGLPASTAYLCFPEKEGMVFVPGTPRRVLLADRSIDDFQTTLYEAAEVEGQVVNVAGKPLAGVRVKARWSPVSVEQECVTGPTGRFVLGGLLPGVQQLHAIPAGFDQYESEDDLLELSLGAGEHKTGVRLLCGVGASFLAGAVTDESGLALASARVAVYGDGLSAAVDTDEDGRFHMAPLPGGRHDVRVSCEGYQTAERRVETGEELSFSLSRITFRSVAGRVVDGGTGDPVTVYSIGVLAGYRREPSWGDEQRLVPVSDADGCFELGEVDTGHVTILVHASGYGFEFYPLPAATDPLVDDVLIPLARTASLRGLVVDAAGAPVAYAPIYVWPFNHFYPFMEESPRTIRRQATCVADADGTFTLDSLPLIPFLLRAYHQDEGLGYVALGPPRERPNEVRIQLTHGGQLEGVVVLDGEPVSGAMVIVSHHDLQEYGERTETGPDGQYTVSGVPVGPVRVSARLPGMAFSGEHVERKRDGHDAVVAAECTTRVDLLFPEAVSTVRGRFTEFGVPPEMGVIDLTVESVLGREWNRVMADKDGRFELSNLPAGPATLSAFILGDATCRKMKRLSLEVPASGDVSVYIDLVGTARLSGRVVGRGVNETARVQVFEGDVTVAPDEVDESLRLSPLIQGYDVIGPNTDETEYAICGLEPGIYTVLACCYATDSIGQRVSASRYTVVRVVLAGGERETLDLDFR